MLASLMAHSKKNLAPVSVDVWDLSGMLSLVRKNRMNFSLMGKPLVWRKPPLESGLLAMLIDPGHSEVLHIITKC